MCSVNNNLSYEKVTDFTLSAGISSNIKVYENGIGGVSIRATITKTGGWTTGYNNIMTLPARLRPSDEIVSYAWPGGGRSALCVHITNTGTVRVYVNTIADVQTVGAFPAADGSLTISIDYNLLR